MFLLNLGTLIMQMWFFFEMGHFFFNFITMQEKRLNPFLTLTIIQISVVLIPYFFTDIVIDVQKSNFTCEL